ncbi:hypothetical protein TNCV_3525841 [Trichonephila clavipes]|nr:hypothetical protein TNCV_3525841 [Trichonephila clavipes]
MIRVQLSKKKRVSNEIIYARKGKYQTLNFNKFGGFRKYNSHGTDVKAALGRHDARYVETLRSPIIGLRESDKESERAGRRAVLLARWIVRSVPLEIVGSSGHEKVPTRGKPGLERPGRPRGERIEGSCGKHLWTPQ